MGFSHQKLGLQADDLRRAVTLTMATMGWRNHGMALGLGKPWVFFPWENMGKYGKSWENMGNHGNVLTNTTLVFDLFPPCENIYLDKIMFNLVYHLVI